MLCTIPAGGRKSKSMRIVCAVVLSLWTSVALAEFVLVDPAPDDERFWGFYRRCIEIDH